MQTPKFLPFAILLSFQALAVVPTYELLKDRRSEVVLPSLTQEEKKIILDQARLIFRDMYVHRDLKLKEFGPETDPLPLLDALDASMSTLSERDFHQKVSDAFIRQHDLHTIYSLPKPYSCYVNYLPVRFKLVEKDGQETIGVQSVVDKPEVAKLLPAPIKAQVGDELVSYAGVPALKALADLRPISMGANPDAEKLRALRLLGSRKQKLFFAPDSDGVELTFKDKNGETYTETLPWISEADPVCLKSIESPATKPMKGDEWNDFNRFYRPSRTSVRKSLSLGQLQPTKEPILGYMTFKNENGTFGVIRLESFSPEKLTVDEVILEIRNLLRTTLAATDGLIFDVRENGGGLIDLAEKLIQLFNPRDAEVMNFILKSSDTNLLMMKKFEGGIGTFTQAILDAKAQGQAYTSPRAMFKAKNEELLGQYYFKPVAVLNNADCYSSCDMFSAQMQDQGAAIVFGESASTGAGGANNYSLLNIVTTAGDTPGAFKKIPSGGDIGFAFRQTIRVGTHRGQLVEDVGVVPDVRLHSTLGDLANSEKDLLSSLTARLIQEAPRHTSSAKFRDELNNDFFLNQKPLFHAEWVNTTAMEFKRAGSSVGRIDLSSPSSGGEDLDLSSVLSTADTAEDRIEIFGMNGEERVWRKVIHFRTVPESFVLKDQSISMDFSTASTLPWVTLLKTVNGWTVRDEALKLGAGPQYANNFSTDLLLFADLEGAYTLSFDAVVDTEKDFDFFKVIVKPDGAEAVELEKLSGTLALKNYSYDLSAYAGKKVEIRLTFAADEAVAGTGVTVDNLVIKPKVP